MGRPRAEHPTLRNRSVAVHSALGIALRLKIARRLVGCRCRVICARLDWKRNNDAERLGSGARVGGGNG